MDDVSDVRALEPSWRSELADVTGMDLSALLSSTEDVLSNAVRRLIAEVGDEHEVIAGHGNAVR